MTSILVRGSRVSVLLSTLLKSNQAHLTSTSGYLLKNNNTFGLPHNNGFRRHLPWFNRSLCTSMNTSPNFQGKQLDVDHSDQGVPPELLRKRAEEDKSQKFKAKGYSDNRLLKSKKGFLKRLPGRLSNKELNLKQAFLLLKSCGRTMENETSLSRTELVEYVWEELGKKGLRDTSLWNTLLSVHIENKHEFDPLLFLQNMTEESKSAPNQSTFEMLVQYYAQRGDVSGALKMMEEMIQNGNTILTEDLYAWIVFAFVKTGDLDGVNEITETMEEAGLQRTETTYGLLINAHAECGDIEGIDKTINEMVSKDIYPTTKTYMDILTHLVDSNHHELFGEALNKMDIDDKIQEHIYHLIQCSCTNGNYESALKLYLLTEKQTGSDVGYKSHIAKNLFLRLFNNAWKGPEDFLEMVQLIDNRLGGEKGSLNFLIQFFISSDKPDQAIKTLQLVINGGKMSNVDRLDVEDCFKLLLFRINDKNQVSNMIELYKSMMENGIGPAPHQLTQKKIGSLLPADDKTFLQEELKSLLWKF